MFRGQRRHGLAYLSDRIRLSFNRLLYDGLSGVMMDRTPWQESLISVLAPQAGERVFLYGKGSGRMAIVLACRFHEASFAGIEPEPAAAENAARKIARRQIDNAVVKTASGNQLPFEAGSFDKGASVLAFHDRTPEQKDRLASELRRVLRRSGSLCVADYDAPTNTNEQRILRITARISGVDAARSHLDGSWTNLLVKAGFVGVRRRAAHSVGIGRIAVIKARKQ